MPCGKGSAYPWLNVEAQTPNKYIAIWGYDWNVLKLDLLGFEHFASSLQHCGTVSRDEVVVSEHTRFALSSMLALLTKAFSYFDFRTSSIVSNSSDTRAV